MTQVKWIYVALYSSYFVNFLAVTQLVQIKNPTKKENLTETHRKLHNITLDRGSNNNNISRKERFPSNLEYRLMRMEVQFIEKFDRINSEIRENNNRLQNLEWQYAETQRSIDGSLPMLEAYLRQQPHQSQHYPSSTSPPPPTSVVGTIDDRLNKLAEATANLIATSRVFYRDLAEMKGNVSNIAVMTKNIYDGSHHFVTTSTLNKALKSTQFSSLSSLSSSIKSKLSQQCQQNDKNRTYRNSCLEILNSDSNTRSGIYQIHPNPRVDPIMVYCDMSTSGGGWTVIQNRYDGSQDFYRPWHEYKRGFGNIGGEFWLGLDNIHDLTDAVVNELLVELEDQDGVRVFARYATFSIASEVERYRLRALTGYRDYNTVVYEERSGDFSSRPRSGNNNNNTVAEEDSIAAGDSLSYHAGSRFSTFDVDEDNWLEGNCAQSHGGGWWYNQCDRSNLNGRYLQPVDQVGDRLLPEHLAYHGMYWHTFHGPRYSLRKARMFIRPTISVAQGDGIPKKAEDKVSGEDNDNLYQMIRDLFGKTD